MPAERSAFSSEEARQSVMESYDRLVARWPVAAHPVWIETHLGKTHGLAFGKTEGPALVLLHGGGGNATMWLHNARELARGFRVYALDLPGEAGKSDGIRPELDSGAHLRWLGEVMDQLGLERAFLVGASFGAWVAHQFAVAKPQRVRRLCLFAPPHLLKVPLKVVVRAILATLWPSEKRLHAFFRYLSAPGAPALPEWALADWRTRWRGAGASPQPPIAADAELASLPAGATVVLGTDDPLCEAATAERRLAAHAPQVEVVTWQQAGHILTVDRAREVGPLLERWL